MALRGTQSAPEGGGRLYGRVTGNRTANNPSYPIDNVAELKAPVLGLYGKQDQSIPQDTLEQMKQAIANGPAVARGSQFVVYETRRTRFSPTTARAIARPTPRTAGAAPCLVQGARRQVARDQGVAPAATGRDGFGAPLAPRAGVERRAVQAGDLHRERVVARGHARAALQHHAVRRGAADGRTEHLTQFVGALEAAVGGEVVLEVSRFSAPGCGRPPDRWSRSRRDSGRRRERRSADGRAWSDCARQPWTSTVTASGLPALKLPGAFAGTCVSSGRPAASQASRPPSSSATESCPSQRSGHPRARGSTCRPARRRQ